MKTFPRFLSLLLALASSLALAGCLNLKPAVVNVRHYVLFAGPGAQQTNLAAAPRTPIGVAQVKLPSYLLRESIAIRSTPGEITYLEDAIWAERLDLGFQRVFAADLSSALPTDQVRLGVWRPEDVAVEVRIAVEQFDVDQEGMGRLTAWWLITAPGNGKLLKSGKVTLAKQGHSPVLDERAIPTTLSALIMDLSAELAQVIKQVTPPPQASPRRMME